MKLLKKKIKTDLMKKGDKRLSGNKKQYSAHYSVMLQSWNVYCWNVLQIKQ